ncbi:11551_t:CDS:2, partial [Funneliformis geosporum]
RSVELTQCFTEDECIETEKYKFLLVAISSGLTHQKRTFRWYIGGVLSIRPPKSLDSTSVEYPDKEDTKHGKKIEEII